MVKVRIRVRLEKANASIIKKYYLFVTTDPNWSHTATVSPTPRTLGRQKRIIEPCITPSSTPIPQTSSDDSKTSSEQKAPNKAFDKLAEIHSPESPLSKMNIMPNLAPHVTTSRGNLDELLSPKSITQLEFPTPERLLPIGQHGKDGMSSLAEKVREVLSINDISHLKQESSFEKSEVISNCFIFWV